MYIIIYYLHSYFDFDHILSIHLCTLCTNSYPRTVSQVVPHRWGFRSKTLSTWPTLLRHEIQRYVTSVCSVPCVPLSIVCTSLLSSCPLKDFARYFWHALRMSQRTAATVRIASSVYWWMLAKSRLPRLPLLRTLPAQRSQPALMWLWQETKESCLLASIVMCISRPHRVFWSVSCQNHCWIQKFWTLFNNFSWLSDTFRRFPDGTLKPKCRQEL